MADPDSPVPVSAPKASLYRAHALEAIDSREGLDELMTIVPARSLYALIAIGAVIIAGLLWGIFGRVPIVERGTGVVTSNTGLTIVSASANGTLTGDPVAIGTPVTRGEVVARLRTATLESSPLRAPIDGTVVDVNQKAFASIKRGDAVVTIEPNGASLQIVGFVDYRAQPPVAVGMAARATPIDNSGVAAEPLRGRVSLAAPEPATDARVASVLGNAGLASTLHGSVREVSIAVDKDAVRGSAGSPYSIVVVVGEVSPLAFLFPRER